MKGKAQTQPRRIKTKRAAGEPCTGKCQEVLGLGSCHSQDLQSQSHNKVCWNGSLELQEKQEGGGLCFPFLPPSRGDAGSPPYGCPDRGESPRATCWEPEMEGFPACSLLALTSVVLAACRCSQHSDSSRGRNGKWGGFLGVLPVLCCRP